MKRPSLAVLIICFALSLPAPSKAIGIWHSNSVWAGQGMCAYTFTLDGQDVQFESGSGVRDLTIKMVLLDDSGKPLSDVQTVQIAGPFADSEATRYVNFFLEGDCDTQKFGMVEAVGIIDGKQVDFLKNGKIEPQMFDPLKILLAK